MLSRCALLFLKPLRQGFEEKEAAEATSTDGTVSAIGVELSSRDQLLINTR